MNESINIAMPNTSVEKMKSILALSEAVKDIARALVSTQVSVTIANNVVHGTINVDQETNSV